MAHWKMKMEHGVVSTQHVVGKEPIFSLVCPNTYSVYQKLPVSSFWEKVNEIQYLGGFEHCWKHLI